MIRTSRSTFTLLLIPLLLLLGGCGSNSTGASSSGSETPCDKQSTIRGTIVMISQASSGASPGYAGGILIDSTKEQKAEFDKVYASIHTNTRVFEKQGQECRSVSFATLKIGQRVQIQSTGIVRQTYPPQIDATEIVILSP